MSKHSGSNTSLVSITTEDLARLPVTKDNRGARILGVVLVAVPWTIIGVISASSDSPPWPVFIVIGIFSLVGLWLALTKQTVTLGLEDLTFKQSGPTGSKQWTERYENYRGVGTHSEVRRSKDSSYTVYIASLVHADGSRTFKLGEWRSAGLAREMQETAARTFNLPALERTTEGYIERSVEDLDKTVGELVKEGKVALNFDPSAPPPADIKLTYQGDTAVLESASKKGGIFGRPRTSLRISPQELELKLIIAFGRGFTTRMPTAEVESVTLAPPSSGGSGPPRVTVAGDRQQMDLYVGDNEASQVWLRDFVIAMLALNADEPHRPDGPQRS